MHIKLEYFTIIGHYVSCAEYESECDDIDSIYSEVTKMQHERRLPRCPENGGVITLVSVPGRSRDWARLIL